jgi:hypothetical protein
MQTNTLFQTGTHGGPNTELKLIERWLRTLPGEAAKALEQALITHDTGTVTRYRLHFRAWLQRAS